MGSTVKLSLAALEEAIALGADRVVACGGAGALTPELTMSHIVLQLRRSEMKELRITTFLRDARSTLTLWG